MQAAHCHYTPAKGERVRVISDLHLGHQKCQAPSPQKLIESMQGVDTLIIAGDVAETRRGPWQETGLQMRQELHHYAQQAGIKLILLAGNHDPDIDCQMLSLWGGKIVIIHGHQLFEEIAPWGWEYLQDKKACKAFIQGYPQRHHNLEQRLLLARQLSERVSPKMQHKFKTGIKLLDHALHCFWPPMRPFQILKAWYTAPRRAQDFVHQFTPKTRCLIFGHVHRLGHWKGQNCDFYTTGAWFKHARPAYLDLRDGEVDLYKKLS